MELIKNKIYRAQMVDYTADGTAIAKIDGRAIFVPGGAVGDQCDIRILKLTKNAAFGRIEQIIVPSKHRIEPVCDKAGRCGGCCYQHLTYEEELRAKEKKVRDALERIGGQDSSVLTGITGAPRIDHYRNKAQYPVGLDAEGRVVTGFYRARSHEIVPIERCAIQSEISDRLAGVVRGWMSQNDVQPYDHLTHRGMVRHIYVRVGQASGECQLTLVVSTRKLPALDMLVSALRAAEPSLTGVLLNLNRREDNVILGERTVVLWGESMLEDRLCGNSFLLSPQAFYQVNPVQAEKLYACAVDYAALTGSETVVELYCGAGTITLALAKKAKRVIGAEVVRAATENAAQNAIRNGIENTEFICADAAQAAMLLTERGEKPEVVVVDPPRRGLESDALAAILRMSPARLVYVSCDPATLARDIKGLSENGYALCAAHAFDLFPRTSHVETVALLQWQNE